MLQTKGRACSPNDLLATGVHVSSVDVVVRQTDAALLQ